MSDEGLSKCGELEAERDIARQENERLRALLRQIQHNMDRYAKDTRMSWPRFLWTPHCSMEPRRKEAHE
jgi:hypothetical protein